MHNCIRQPGPCLLRLVLLILLSAGLLLAYAADAPRKCPQCGGDSWDEYRCGNSQCTLYLSDQDSDTDRHRRSQGSRTHGHNQGFDSWGLPRDHQRIPKQSFTAMSRLWMLDAQTQLDNIPLPSLYLRKARVTAPEAETWSEIQIINEKQGDKSSEGEEDHVHTFPVEPPEWLMELTLDLTQDSIVGVPNMEGFYQLVVNEYHYQATPLTAGAEITLDAILTAVGQPDQLLFFWAQQISEGLTSQTGVILVTDDQGHLFIMTDLEDIYNSPTYCPEFGDWLKKTFEGSILEAFSFEKT